MKRLLIVMTILLPTVATAQYNDPAAQERLLLQQQLLEQQRQQTAAQQQMLREMQMQRLDRPLYDCCPGPWTPARPFNSFIDGFERGRGRR